MVSISNTVFINPCVSLNKSVLNWTQVCVSFIEKPNCTKVIQPPNSSKNRYFLVNHYYFFTIVLGVTKTQVRLPIDSLPPPSIENVSKIRIMDCKGMTHTIRQLSLSLSLCIYLYLSHSLSLPFSTSHFTIFLFFSISSCPLPPSFCLSSSSPPHSSFSLSLFPFPLLVLFSPLHVYVYLSDLFSSLSLSLTHTFSLSLFLLSHSFQRCPSWVPGFERALCKKWERERRWVTDTANNENRIHTLTRKLFSNSQMGGKARFEVTWVW